MKNLILVSFFALSLMLTAQSCKAFAQVQDPPTISQAQDIQQDQMQQEGPQPEKHGFLADWGNKAKAYGYVIAFGIIAVFLARKGWLMRIKRVTSTLTVGLKEGSDLLLALSRLSNAVDRNLTNDNKVVENSWKEAISAGKEVRAELDDMVVIFKPKK